jgi:hypothetical protein
MCVQGLRLLLLILGKGVIPAPPDAGLCCDARVRDGGIRQKLAAGMND